MKTMTIIGAFVYFFMKELHALIHHQQLRTGILIILLTAFAGIFFVGYLQLHREQTKIRKKIGNKAVDWMLMK